MPTHWRDLLQYILHERIEKPSFETEAEVMNIELSPSYTGEIIAF